MSYVEFHIEDNEGVKSAFDLCRAKACPDMGERPFAPTVHPMQVRKLGAPY